VDLRKKYMTTTTIDDTTPLAEDMVAVLSAAPTSVAVDPTPEPVVHTVSFTDEMIDSLFGHGEIRHLVNKIIADLKTL